MPFVSVYLPLIFINIVLPPFPTEGLTAADVDGLIERVRGAMLAELIRLSSEEGEQRKDY